MGRVVLLPLHSPWNEMAPLLSSPGFLPIQRLLEPKLGLANRLAELLRGAWSSGKKRACHST